MTVTTRTGADDRVVTRLTGRVADQTALTGMLDALAQLHLPILTVETIGSDNREGLDGPGDDLRE
jgi:hypothetical protein